MMALQYIFNPGLWFDDKERILEGMLQLQCEDNTKEGIFEIVEENNVDDKGKLDMIIGIKGKYIIDLAFIKKNSLGGEKGIYQKIGDVIASQYINKPKNESIDFAQQIFRERQGILFNKIQALYKSIDCMDGSDLLASDFGEKEMIIYLSERIHKDVNYKAFYYGNKNTPLIRGLLSFYNMKEQVELKPGFIMAVYDRMEKLEKKEREEKSKKNREEFMKRIKKRNEEKEIEELKKEA